MDGFKVEARDGSIGTVERVTYAAGMNFIVVATGPRSFGRKVLIPAGVIDDVDPDTETVFVSVTKDEIENAPDLDEARSRGL